MEDKERSGEEGVERSEEVREMGFWRVWLVVECL